MLTGGHIFDDTDVKLHDNDNIYSDLFEETGDNEFDVLTQQAVEVIFHAFLIILEHQCAIQLSGGKYWNQSTTIREAASFVPTTNRSIRK